jgi:methylenetetrahydrofolate dehydrogenase (NADP+)/methenyltetrahydrofolate cyclohydrolase
LFSVIGLKTGKAKFTGDVDPARAEIAGYLGVVDPMTRAMLRANVVKAAELPFL